MARTKFTVTFPAAKAGDQVTWPNTVKVYPDNDSQVPLQPGQSLDETLTLSGWSESASVAFSRRKTDGTTETVTVTSASPTRSGAAVPTSAAYRGSTSLPVSNGTDDTTALNTILAAASGKLVTGVPGQVYLTSAPLVIPSNVVLDMTGCTVRLIVGSNTNIVQNSAVGTVRRVLDAVTTSASTTLTSATAAFTSGDVGKAITIQGAGAAGVPLTTTIASVTNGTTAVLTAAAGTSVTGQYAAIGSRDSDITVIGGLWDRQTNSSPTDQTLAHLLRFRHVDGLTVRNVKCASGAVGSKYAINPGDCTDVLIDGVRIGTHYSDAIHLSGPCARVTVRNVVGDNMGDDLVSMTARDSTTVITDCAGDITDVLVDGAFMASELGGGLFACALKVIAGRTTDASASYNVKRLTARNITGPTTTAAAVYIGDTSLGVISDVLLDGVRSLGGGAGSFAAVYVNNATINDLTIRGLVNDSTDKSGVLLDSVTSNKIVVDDAFCTGGATSNGGIVYVDKGCTITQLSVLGSTGKFANGGTSVVNIANGVTPKASIANLLVADTYFESGSGSGAGLVRNQDSGVTLTTVEVSNYVSANSNYALGFYGGTTTILARNVRSYGAALSSWARAAGSAVLTIFADGLQGTLDGVNIDAGGAIRCKGFGFPVDVGTTGITKAVGDAAYNTNAARACGVGPVVSDGTSWKGLFTGATF